MSSLKSRISSARPKPRALPGFYGSLTVTLLWVGLLVVIPLTALVVCAARLGPIGLWESLDQERVLNALGLSFGAAGLASLINLPLGLLLAFVLVRRRFPGAQSPQTRNVAVYARMEADLAADYSVWRTYDDMIVYRRRSRSVT